MNIDFEENDDNREQSEEQRVDWSDYAYQQEGSPLMQLDRTDYIALFVASLQTILLPLVVLIGLLFVVNFWLQIVAG